MIIYLVICTINNNNKELFSVFLPNNGSDFAELVLVLKTT